jgi:hypothetical protein
LAFVDLEKVYDSINRQEIWKLLDRANVSKGLIGRIKKIYDKCENSRVADSKKSERVQMCRGVRQGSFYPLCW